MSVCEAVNPLEMLFYSKYIFNSREKKEKNINENSNNKNIEQDFKKQRMEIVRE